MRWVDDLRLVRRYREQGIAHGAQHTLPQIQAFVRLVEFPRTLVGVEPRQFPAELHQVPDLVQLRGKLARLDADERTRGLYQADESLELRESVLSSVRDTLFAIAAD